MPRHCEGTIAPDRTHCEDHSGQQMWMRGIATLLLLATGLLAYSVFWQAPALRTEIAKEVGRVDGDLKLVRRDVDDLRSRVGNLENGRKR